MDLPLLQMRNCSTQLHHTIVKAMLRILIPSFIGLSIALTGCATLTRDECKSGDWHKIGLNDGNDGRTESRFKQHGKACELDRSEVSKAAYMAGREKGLANYCTKVRGYREGALGQKYYDVCKGASGVQFLSGFEFGKRIHKTESRSSDVANEIHAVSQKLQQPSLTDAQRTPLLQQQRELQTEDGRIKEELKSLRTQADALVSSSRKKN